MDLITKLFEVLFPVFLIIGIGINVISNPKIDGREIALTHHSVKILKKLNLKLNISKNLCHVILYLLKFE